MQPLLDPTRTGLTEAQVVGLIRDGATLIVDSGLEIINTSLYKLVDISADLLNGSVTRGSFNTLHSSCTLSLSKTDIDYGNTIARPYMILSDGTISARFNLGAYLLASPTRILQTEFGVYDAIGYDILKLLDDPVGESFSVPAGMGYLASVESILISQGFVQYIIDNSATASVLPAARVWPIDERTTWLTVVNDLLGAIGYAGIWSDWDGRLRVEPYVTPTSRAMEWEYNSSLDTSMIYPKKTIEDDFFEAPNRWVAIRQNNTESSAPVEGNGIATFDNFGNGKTSQSARGRTITKVFMVDAADQLALVARAQITVDADMRRTSKIEASTSPNPLHWHFDRLGLVDPAIGNVQVMGTEWTLPLDGGDMTHKWTVL